MNFISCSSVFYYPDNKEYFDPKVLGFKKQDYSVETKDKTKLSLWRIFPTQSTDNQTVILQFHGNAENMSSHYVSLAWLVNHGFELHTYDYRGYGKSEGSPNPEDINIDSVLVIQKTIEYCIEKNKKLILYGQSLGGAILMRTLADLKDKSNIALVVIEGSFTSYRKVARSILQQKIIEPIPFLLSSIVSNSYSPEEYISKISPIPMIVIHEEEDTTVPFENGKEIFRLADQPKQFMRITGGGHLRWMNMGRTENAKNFAKLLSQFIKNDPFKSN